MRDRMERFVLLPFSVGCVSESSIDVAVHHHHQPRRSKLSADHQITNSSAIRIREEDEESISNESMKGSFRFVANSKPGDRSNGFHRLCKSFKNFSQLFVYKEEMEELEEEMEIGFPTDVKHVTHIGVDGCTTAENNSIKGWDNLIAPGLLSLGQFELSMAAKAEAPEALVKNSIHQLN